MLLEQLFQMEQITKLISVDLKSKVCYTTLV